MPTPDVLAMLAKLPPRCFVQLSGSRGPRVAEIVRGVAGVTDIDTVLTAEALNAALPEPPMQAQLEAMLYGAIHGWHLAGADADLTGDARDDRLLASSLLAPSLGAQP